MRTTTIQPASGILVGQGNGYYGVMHIPSGEHHVLAIYYGSTGFVRCLVFLQLIWWARNANDSPAGAGKTKLVSTVIGSLRRDLGEGPQGEALAYFYCDRNQPDRQSHEQILKSFVRQLSTPRDSDMIPSCIDKRYSEKEKPGFASSSFTFQECCALVPELVRVYSKVTLVLDALDECDRSTRHLLINEIDKLVGGSTSCIIKVFILSRPDKDIKHRFQCGGICVIPLFSRYRGADGARQINSPKSHAALIQELTSTKCGGSGRDDGMVEVAVAAEVIFSENVFIDWISLSSERRGSLKCDLSEGSPWKGTNCPPDIEGEFHGWKSNSEKKIRNGKR